jgi:hypothetical protein
MYSHIYLCFRSQVTVFDFSTILERTERRVRDDLLGGGPKTVVELRSIAGRLRLKYQTLLERRIQRHQQQQARAAGGAPSPNKVNEAFSQGFSQAGSFFAKMKTPTFAMKAPTFAMKAPTFALPGVQRKEQAPPAPEPEPQPEPTIVNIPDMLDTKVAKAPVSAGAGSDEGDWVGTDMTPATDGISNFSIGDEDDEDIML